MKILESEGIIQTKRNRGITFRELTPRDIKNIYDVRIALEGLATKNAAVNMTPEDIRHLQSYAKQYSRARKEGKKTQWEKADREIHEKIIQISGNWYLINMVKKFRILTTSFAITAKQPKKGTGDSNPVSHNDIIDALVTGDPEMAASSITAHILWIRDRTLALIDIPETCPDKAQPPRKCRMSS